MRMSQSCQSKVTHSCQSAAIVMATDDQAALHALQASSSASSEESSEPGGELPDEVMATLRGAAQVLI